MSTITGSGVMLALTVRRERLHASAWYGSVALVMFVIAAGVVAAYPTESSRQSLAESVAASAGELFLIGPISSTDVGGVAQWRTQGLASLLIGLASILTVVRNTRASEENGTGELLGAARVGRTAPVIAALGIAAGASILAGVVVGAGFVIVGAAAGGSILVGAQVAVFGLLAAGVGALACQVVRTARAATGIGVAIIAAFFVLRGVGDALGGAGYWLSPFGWIAAVRPFADHDAAMLLPAVGLAAVLAAAAASIASRRDFGAGLFRDRVGRARASVALRGAFSLAMRVSRGAIISWAAGALLLGLLIGAVSPTVDEQIALEFAGDAGGAGLVPVALYLSPLFAAVLGIQTTLRVRREVTSGRAEAVLSRPVGRARWLLSHSATGAFGALAFLLAFGLGLGLAATAADPGALGTLTAAAAVRVAAAWVFVALTTVLLASVPRAASAITYTVLGLYLALELAVEFRFVPAEALYASPFALVPQLPTGPGHPWQTALLLAIAAALIVLASRTIRRQDIQ